MDYQDHQEVLGRLEVESASLDMVCLVDHAEERLFVAVRGTDRMINHLTFPRDWGNNMRILVGLEPGCTLSAIDEYRAVRMRFPRYASYGSGHSLGGTVVLHLATYVEADSELQFARIDIFNTAVSPLTRSLAVLTKTTFHAHRVPGDWVSWGLCNRTPPAGSLHTHPVKPHVRECHSLRHFLPDKAGDLAHCLDGRGVVPDGEMPTDSLVERREEHREEQPFWASLRTFSCVGVRSKANPATRPSAGVRS